MRIDGKHVEAYLVCCYNLAVGNDNPAEIEDSRTDFLGALIDAADFVAGLGPINITPEHAEEIHKRYDEIQAKDKVE